MIFHAFIVGLLLTGTGVMLMAIKLGSAGLLYVAAVDASALWLLPGAVMLAAPAGAFGGVLFKQADRTSRYGRRKDLTGETIRLALAAAIVSALTVGWLVPQAHQETGRSMARFQQDDTVKHELLRLTFDAIPIDELMTQADVLPGAWEEVLWRAMWIAASFALPLAASALVTVKRRWTYPGATAATLVVFAMSVQLAFQGLV